MKDKNYDFAGWATVHNVQCADGKTIDTNCFAHMDGQKVPVVWMHGHDDVRNVLGSGYLTHSQKGMWIEGTFNHSAGGQAAKAGVDNGDIVSLSIYANKLQMQHGLVKHGEIKEVSLVLAGANPHAHIQEVIRHGEVLESECVIFTGEFLQHEDDVDDVDESLDISEVYDTFTDEEKYAVEMIVSSLTDE